jgi:protoheme IX farnesyltransferase
LTGTTKLSRDLIELTKPGIVRMCLITTAGGLWLAPGELDVWTVVAALVGSALAVASANTFNMVWEHETDRLMRRTRLRPVAARRLPVSVAAGFAGLLAVAAWLVLILGTNPLTTAIALLALASYVFVYTPLKFKTPLALVVGAIPGAAPPLLGWTAATGEVSAGGIALFAILLIWQIPHFLAIAIYRKSEYAAAGIRCVPIVRGDGVAKLQAAAWAGLLIPVSLVLTPLGVTGGLYLGVAAILSLAFFGWSLSGFRPGAGVRWARGYFLASLVYLPALTAALVLDRLLAWMA